MGSNLEHAIADTLSRLGPMPITDLVNALSLMGTPGCSLKNVKSTLKSNSSLFGEGEGGWSCLKCVTLETPFLDLTYQVPPF